LPPVSTTRSVLRPSASFTTSSSGLSSNRIVEFAVAAARRTDAVACDLIDDLAEARARIPVAKREDRIEMHRGPALGQDAGDHAASAVLPEQLVCELAHGLMCRTRAEAKNYIAVVLGF
jgi:hypothetical protein